MTPYYSLIFGLVLHFIGHQIVLLTVIVDVLVHIKYVQCYINILAFKLSILSIFIFIFILGAWGVHIAVDSASPANHIHVTGQMPVN